MGEGFQFGHEIVENAHDWAYDKYERHDQLPEITRLTTEARATRRAKQATWGPMTDCGRLDVAFATPNAQGIVARLEFRCCNNCGFTEIWDEVEIEEKRHFVEECVFDHLQRTVRAIRTGQLLTPYGCVEEHLQVFVAVTHKVVDRLRKVGRNASWAGTGGYLTVIEGLMWCRRRK